MVLFHLWSIKGRKSHLTFSAAMAEMAKAEILKSHQYFYNGSLLFFLRVYNSCLQSVITFGRFYFSPYDTFWQSTGHANVHIANRPIYEFICIVFSLLDITNQECMYVEPQNASYIDAEGKGKNQEIGGGLRKGRQKVNLCLQGKSCCNSFLHSPFSIFPLL